jgi:GntR family transcriptional regulator/MocR family aminotransferase
VRIPLAELLLAGLEAPDCADLPAHRRVFEAIRRAILSHQLPGGAKLPSTRDLAIDLGYSRNTMLVAYDQLLAEGYVEARTGSGTYVADTLPSYLRQTATQVAPQAPSMLPRTLSQRGCRLTAAPADRHFEIQEFVALANDFSAFPHKLWQRLQNKYWRSPDARILDYARAGGYQPLRETLAEYLRVSRSVRLSAEQVLITAGTQQSLDLCARLLADCGDTVWMENPGYWGARRIFDATDLKLRPIAVDAEGINPDSADLATSPRLVYVTPSHQYPTDVVMSLSRRRLLLEFAARCGAWILEDDYDSEFRYGGRPLASLQGLDNHERVIYLGTFSKVLYPGIRIGYIVVPPDLIKPFRVGLSDIHRPGQMAVQAALSDFIKQGHFAAHIRNVRNRYGQCRALLQHTLQHTLDATARLSDADTGLHLVIRLPPHCDDVALVAEAWRQRIDVKPLSAYYLAPPVARGLVVGYGYTPLDETVPSAKRLAELVNRHIAAMA